MWLDDNGFFLLDKMYLETSKAAATRRGEGTHSEDQVEVEKQSVRPRMSVRYKSALRVEGYDGCTKVKANCEDSL